jgi:thiol:disulfide interchange protein DsbD
MMHRNSLEQSTSAARRWICLPLLLAALPLGLPVWAQGSKDSSPHSDAGLISENTTIRPGVPFTVALRLRMEPHWHSYWRNSGDSGFPTNIRWKLPPGFRAGAIQWPYPQRIETPPLVTYAFEKEVWLLTQITPPASLPKGKAVVLRASAKWLVCKEECVPAQADLSLSLPVSSTTRVANARWSAAFARSRAALPVAPAGLKLRVVRAAGGKGLVLFVQAPAGREKAVAGAHFFAGEASVIAHAAKQKVERAGRGFRITLVASEYAPAPPKRLRGVLVAPKGQAWNKAGARALSVDVPVEAASSNRLSAIRKGGEASDPT